MPEANGPRHGHTTPVEVSAQNPENISASPPSLPWWTTSLINEEVNNNKKKEHHLRHVRLSRCPRGGISSIPLIFFRHLTHTGKKVSNARSARATTSASTPRPSPPMLSGLSSKKRSLFLALASEIGLFVDGMEVDAPALAAADGAGVATSPERKGRSEGVRKRGGRLKKREPARQRTAGDLRG